MHGSFPVQIVFALGAVKEWRLKICFHKEVSRLVHDEKSLDHFHSQGFWFFRGGPGKTTRVWRSYRRLAFAHRLLSLGRLEATGLRGMPVR